VRRNGYLNNVSEYPNSSPLGKGAQLYYLCQKLQTKGGCENKIRGSRFVVYGRIAAAGSVEPGKGMVILGGQGTK